MLSVSPLRLLHQNNGIFWTAPYRESGIHCFDIISYENGEIGKHGLDAEIAERDEEIQVASDQIKGIARLMETAGIEYLWAESVCIRHGDEQERSDETAKIPEYYRSTQTCHILIDMSDAWKTQQMVDDLRFLDHVIAHMSGVAIASESTTINANTLRRINDWAGKPWIFPVSQHIAKAAGTDLGVLNCFATCTKRLTSVFDNVYFTQMSRFQEMILGKNIRIWAQNDEIITEIGNFNTLIDLVTEARDKAEKLRRWVESSRVLKSASVTAIACKIEQENQSLKALQLILKGIESARIDVITGGPCWWHDNAKGIHNIFSILSAMPRTCKHRRDMFFGLFGIFKGLFTPEEITRNMNEDDFEKTSFNFFKQLSTKTENAWTILALSSRERGEMDWIPVVEQTLDRMSTKYFASVINLGRMDKKGLAHPEAITGLKGTPRTIASIRLIPNSPEETFRIRFQGCNSGPRHSIGAYSKEFTAIVDERKDIIKDETGKALVQCATVLGGLLDPAGDLVAYRSKLLRKLRPDWHVTDPIAKPNNWENRCVSGTSWAEPHPYGIKVHNRSGDYDFVDLYSCDSRLWNENTAKVSCELSLNCGCTMTAPYAFIFEGLSAVAGSSFGETVTLGNEDNRYLLQDGIGLLNAGKAGNMFSLIAFQGDKDAIESYAVLCRSTEPSKRVEPRKVWPSGRALVRGKFSHGLMNHMRDYGYVETGGSGNLLIFRDHPGDPYRILGVCIDDDISSTRSPSTWSSSQWSKESRVVSIR